MNNKQFCVNCGEELEKESNYCSECGNKIEKIPKKRGRKKKEEIENTEQTSNINETKIETKNEQDTLQEKLIQTEKELNTIKKKNFLSPIIACVITFIICLTVFGLFYEYYLKNLVIETTKREVTITDTGIAEAVDKVYDSVVVVESYYKNKLYSTGTGFVYKTKDDKAYILTNHHVIENSDEVQVVFTNNNKEKVTILGSDAYSDIAVLSVDKSEIISVAELGSSEKLKVGDTAFAVGAPLDSSTYAWTVTRGVISGKNRVVETSSTIMEVLQTDTAINSGNSGGPLCNSNGEVIGINNMRLVTSGVEGMGFAIPIETAIKNAETLMKGQEINRPYIGVEIGMARESYYSEETFVYIHSVEKNSPAYKAGFKSEDIIIAVNDVKINTTVHFQHELYKYKVGDKVRITIKRNGKEKTLVVTLGSKTNKKA